MVRYLRDRLIDGIVTLTLLTVIFEGPTITAIVRGKLKRGRGCP